MEAYSGSYVWLPGIVACVARFLSPNEIACTLRFVDKVTSKQFDTYKTVRLSLPIPAYAFRDRWGRPGAFRGFTRKQRLALLCLTAASGSTENLDVVLASAGLAMKGGELLDAAAGAGQLGVCKMLRERGCPWGSALATAARGGQSHVCEWLLANGCPFRSAAVYAAARGGHEALMDWLVLQQSRLGGDGGGGGCETVVAAGVDAGDLLEAAAWGLSLASLQRLYQELVPAEEEEQQQLQLQQQQQGEGGGNEDWEGQEQQQGPAGLGPGQQVGIVGAAAGSPTPDWRAKVEWLEEQGFPRTAYACECASGAADAAAAGSPGGAAASGGGDGGDGGEATAVGRLLWLCERGYPPHDKAFDRAAAHGDVAALRFLMERAEVQPCVTIDRSAAERGHLAVLRYLHARGFEIGAQSIARAAASQGHLPVVAWAVEALGVAPAGPWTSLLDCAAESGSLEMMTWLYERACSWGSGAVGNAVEAGCEAALEWLVQRGCPWPVDAEPYIDAAVHGDTAMLRCLRRLGCPWAPLLVHCIRRETPLPSLRCLLELGCPVDWGAAAREAERHQRRCSDYSTAVLAMLREERQRRAAAAVVPPVEQALAAVTVAI